MRTARRVFLPCTPSIAPRYQPMLPEDDLKPGRLRVERLHCRCQSQCDPKGRDENDQVPHSDPVGDEEAAFLPVNNKTMHAGIIWT